MLCLIEVEKGVCDELNLLGLFIVAGRLVYIEGATVLLPFKKEIWILSLMLF